ncbi:MAG TPA: DUF5698 domain-containing protein, partial [bacterium]|nr:DUF5698 domain-containing protein [bacterium]
MDFTTMLHVLFLGLIVFGARVIDVSLGTLRTINIIYGRAKIAFILGFLETFVWVYVIATILKYIAQYPVLGVFYALGFATGNVVGVAIEKKLAFGYMLLRVIAMESADTMASSLRDEGYRVTTFAGEGRDGPVT